MVLAFSFMENVHILYVRHHAKYFLLLLCLLTIESPKYLTLPYQTYVKLCLDATVVSGKYLIVFARCCRPQDVESFLKEGSVSMLNLSTWICGVTVTFFLFAFWS